MYHLNVHCLRTPFLIALVCAPLAGQEASDPPQNDTEEGAATARETDERPNMLLVTLGATRADRIGALGHEGARTPNLDGLAARGALFRRAYAQTPMTLPSHASIMTGALPPEHGVHENGQRTLSEDFTTLAEIFESAGYRTGAVVGRDSLGESMGLVQGFGYYDATFGNPDPGSHTPKVEQSATAVTDKVLAWMESSSDPFFAWVHFSDPNRRYAPPNRFELEDTYDGEVAYVDEQIGRLVEWLEARELAGNTLVIAIGDHGESLGDKGEQTHGSFIYESTQRIPLIVHWPGHVKAERVIDDLVQQVDVLPTVVELLGLTAPGEVSGKSLASLMITEAPAEREPATVYLESEFCARNLGWSTLRGLVRGNYKYIQAPTRELYDLTADPGEARNLAVEEADLAAEFEGVLSELHSKLVARSVPANPRIANLTLLLYGLGYTQGTGHGFSGEPATGENPIEHVEVLESLREAAYRGHLHQFERAQEPLKSAVEAFPDSAVFRTLLGLAYSAKGVMPENALMEFETASMLDPDDGAAVFHFARALQARGRSAEAVAHYQVAVELRSDNVTARKALARLLYVQGDIGGLADQYAVIVLLEPQVALNWIQYTNVLPTCGRWAELIDALERAAELYPENWGIQNRLAWWLSTLPDEGLRDGQRSVEVAERICEVMGRGDPNVLDSLAAGYAACGRWAEAVETAESGLEIAIRMRDKGLTDGLGQRLELYRQEKPFISE